MQRPGIGRKQRMEFRITQLVYLVGNVRVVLCCASTIVATVPVETHGPSSSRASRCTLPRNDARAAARGFVRWYQYDSTSTEVKPTQTLPHRDMGRQTLSVCSGTVHDTQHYHADGIETGDLLAHKYISAMSPNRHTLNPPSLMLLRASLFWQQQRAVRSSRGPLMVASSSAAYTQSIYAVMA